MSLTKIVLALCFAVSFGSYAEKKSTADSGCSPNIVTVDKNGNITQTVCQMDTYNLIRLDTITRTKTQTIFDLTVIGGSEQAFCLWPIESKHTFRLIDMDSFEIYRLKSQITDIKECSDSIDYLSAGETMPVKLIFDAIAKTTKRFKLLEDPTLENLSPTVFTPIDILDPQ